MNYFPAALQELTDQFARLPGIGGKTAQRLAFHVLSLPLEDAEGFAEAILNAKREVTTCPKCQNLTDRELCPICADPQRDASVICVVAEPKDVIALEPVWGRIVTQKINVRGRAEGVPRLKVDGIDLKTYYREIPTAEELGFTPAKSSGEIGTDDNKPKKKKNDFIY